MTTYKGEADYADTDKYHHVWCHTLRGMCLTQVSETGQDSSLFLIYTIFSFPHG